MGGSSARFSSRVEEPAITARLNEHDSCSIHASAGIVDDRADFGTLAYRCKPRIAHEYLMALEATPDDTRQFLHCLIIFVETDEGSRHVVDGFGVAQCRQSRLNRREASRTIAFQERAK